MGTALELRKAISLIISSSDQNKEKDTNLLQEIPCKWTTHGNIALLPSTAFTSDNIWNQQYPQVYEQVARILKVTTIARQNGPIQNPNFRQPNITLLYGSDAIARKKENGIWYEWDITKVMFSAGNISEKMRLGSLNLRDKVVVDLFAGIGYFSLTYLIHSKAKFLYACEWNPESLHWLEVNLQKNKVEPERYSILPGDNRITAQHFKGVADHVNLGLIPSSEDSWEVAAAALKRDIGGVLHVHGNVDIDKDDDENGTSKSWQNWSKNVVTKISQIFKRLYPEEEWGVDVIDIVKVKSYGPKVHHLVVDISCKPTNHL